MIKILYLHGLDGSLSDDKREVLEHYFKIVAPQLDYRNTPNMYQKLIQIIEEENIQAVIGNSMGGCFAYYLSSAHNLPTLCFNPALGSRPLNFDFSHVEQSNNYKTFVIGAKDNIVPANQNVEWIIKNVHSDFQINWHYDLEHRIDIGTFEKEVRGFWEVVG